MRMLRLVLLGLAAIIAFVLCGNFVLRAVKSGKVPTVLTEPAPSGPPATQTVPLRAALSPEALATARAGVEDAIAKTPDYARFFDRLRQAFPGDYETIMNMVAAASQGRDVNVDSVMSDAVAALRRAQGTNAVKAPDQALAQIFTLHLAEMKALAERDPHLCVAFLYGANVPGFPAFAADHRALVADAALAGLEAMSAGRSSGVDRGAPSAADFQTTTSPRARKATRCWTAGRRSRRSTTRRCARPARPISRRSPSCRPRFALAYTGWPST